MAKQLANQAAHAKRSGEI